MYKHYCDLCGKEFKAGEQMETYKIKKLQHSWYESWWVKLDAHEDCVDLFIKEVFKRLDENKDDK